MYKKGFTLFETMVSIGIFSVLMMIVFTCWTEFQKISIKNAGKQDTNVTFVNVYRNVDKIVSSANVRLFKHYSDAADLNIAGFERVRWFAFLLSRSNNQLDGQVVYRNIYLCNSETPHSMLDVPASGACPTCGATCDADHPLPQRIIYNTCVVYRIYYPGCCDGFQNCPHKSLYRYVFSVPNIYFASGSNSGTNFKNILNNDVRAVLINRNARPFSVIANNIVDLKIRKNDDKIRFFLRLLRINDAERHFQIGTKQLTDINPATEYDIPEDNEAKNFVEDLSWISVPSNT